MESSDHERIIRLSEGNIELKKLYDEHLALEKKLADYKCRPYLTVEEEVEEKRLKYRKLSGVERMMNIVSGFGSSVESQPYA